MAESLYDRVVAPIADLPRADAWAALMARLEEHELLPYLFEVLLMVKRRELGLPLQADRWHPETEAKWKQALEEHYHAACLKVGRLYLEYGDIAGAWPYLRAARVKEPVLEALERWEGPSSDAEPSERREEIDAVIDLAFQQGLHPVRGYELILRHRGTCDGITALERHFPHGREVREECGVRLVRQLWREVMEGIARDVQAREGKPAGAASIPEAIAGRPWLFEGRSYHVDPSHLQSVIRLAPTLASHSALELAIQLCEYGLGLRTGDQRADGAPFERFYADYHLFLSALAGRETERAIAHFTAKAEAHEMGKDRKHFPGQILVYLLDRLDRPREAAEAYLRFLRQVKEVSATAPAVLRIFDRAENARGLRELAAERRDILQHAASLLIEEKDAPQS
ncbi:MAG: hypothetical protein L0Z55_11015 [Planctomycetes bacterium]|nr:hypothetical protein [Planctomycetota bacterium]